jgi:serine O-acetyltransferase
MIVTDVRKDLQVLKEKYRLKPVLAIISNRGLHALFVYGLSNDLWKYKIALLP